MDVKTQQNDQFSKLSDREGCYSIIKQIDKYSPLHFNERTVKIKLDFYKKPEGYQTVKIEGKASVFFPMKWITAQNHQEKERGLLSITSVFLIIHSTFG